MKTKEIFLERDGTFTGKLGVSITETDRDPGKSRINLSLGGCNIMLSKAETLKYLAILFQHLGMIEHEN